MVKKSYKKRGGAIIQGAEQLNETTTTDDIPMVNKDEPMVNKDEPMVKKDEPMVNKNEPLNEPIVNKNEPTTNEPKKYVDPSGNEWCECPPPKTSGVETVKNFGKNANDAVKNFQDNAIKNVTDTLSQKSQDFKKKMSDKAFNIVGNIFGNKEKTVETNDVIVGGKRRRTIKNSKHKHSKHKHSKHKHSKHSKNKNCTRKHKHKHKNKNCTRKHKHKHKHSKHSKH